MFLTLVGIVSIVIASYIHDTVIAEKQGVAYLAYILVMLSALLLYSFQKIGENYILMKAEFATRRFVGIQGVIGLGVISLLQVVVVFVVYFHGKTDTIGQFFDNFMSGESLALIGKSKTEVFEASNRKTPF